MAPRPEASSDQRDARLSELARAVVRAAASCHARKADRCAPELLHERETVVHLRGHLRNERQAGVPFGYGRLHIVFRRAGELRVYRRYHEEGLGVRKRRYGAGLAARDLDLRGSPAQCALEPEFRLAMGGGGRCSISSVTWRGLASRVSETSNCRRKTAGSVACILQSDDELSSAIPEQFLQWGQLWLTPLQRKCPKA